MGHILTFYLGWLDGNQEKCLHHVTNPGWILVTPCTLSQTRDKKCFKIVPSQLEEFIIKRLQQSVTSLAMTVSGHHLGLSSLQSTEAWSHVPVSIVWHYCPACCSNTMYVLGPGAVIFTFTTLNNNCRNYSAIWTYWW